MNFLRQIDLKTPIGRAQVVRPLAPPIAADLYGHVALPRIWQLPRLLLSMRSACTLLTLALLLLPGTIARAIRRPLRRLDGQLQIRLFFDVFTAPAKVHFAGWPARAGPVGRGM